MSNTKLENLCNDIYRRHKDAFDIVFKNAEMSGAIGEARTAIKEWLKEKCNNSNGELVYTGDIPGTQPKLSFQSQAMNNCLAPLPPDMRGSWSNRDVYYYWFDINRYTGNVRLIVEFGPGKRELTDNDPLVAMGRVINPKKSLQGGVYRRLKSYNAGVVDDDFDKKDLIKKIDDGICRLQKDEKAWIVAFDKERGE